MTVEESPKAVGERIVLHMAAGEAYYIARLLLLSVWLIIWRLKLS